MGYSYLVDSGGETKNRAIGTLMRITIIFSLFNFCDKNKKKTFVFGVVTNQPVPNGDLGHSRARDENVQLGFPVGCEGIDREVYISFHYNTWIVEEWIAALNCGSVAGSL